jgi:hypothetical protein
MLLLSRVCGAGWVTLAVSLLKVSFSASEALKTSLAPNLNLALALI